MALQARIQEAMKAAMRAKDKERLATIRLVLAAIKQKEIDERITLNDPQTLAILDKMLKQRRDAIEQFQIAKRQDLIDKETFEIAVISEFLPAPLSDIELDEIIQHAIQQTHAASPKEMGKVMSIIKPKIQGRADIRAVSEKVKQQLAN